MNNGNGNFVNCDAKLFAHVFNILTRANEISSVIHLGLIDFKLIQRPKDILMINGPSKKSAINNRRVIESEKDYLFEELLKNGKKCIFYKINQLKID